MKQSPIFVKQYDLMLWLIPRTLAFPKSQRGVLARQIQSELFHIHELLVKAGTHDRPRPILAEVDQALIRLRTFLRLSRDLKLLSIGQYEHASRLVAEVGRLLGGWIKSEEAKRFSDKGDRPKGALRPPQ
jgi:hypothetical protein